MRSKPRQSGTCGHPICLAVLLLCALLVCFSIPSATARKELPLSAVFPPVVQDALRCDVCAFIVANALNSVEIRREELLKKRLTLREDEVLEATENMCIPFKDKGQWIRQVGLQLLPATSKTGATEGYRMEVDVVSFYGRCGRTCATVSRLCEEWMDDDAMDAFPGQLLRMSRDANMTDEAHRDALFDKFCHPSRYCSQYSKYKAALERALRTKAELVAEVTTDRPRRMKKEELEMETMMYRLTREQQQSADVFSRDEIRKMQDAFIHGTKEDVAAIDPKAFDLTDEEFHSLREHMLAGDAQRRGGPRGGEVVDDDDGDDNDDL